MTPDPSQGWVGATASGPPKRPPPPRGLLGREPHPSSSRAPIRPGRSTRTSFVGHLLLGAGGVDRDVLDEVPEERHRYIGIGGTVVGTAGLAVGSMALLAATVLDVDGWAILVPALLWGLFVFNLDRWLISSTHGTARRWVLIPRLVLAVLLGIVVAEPVVLWTFRSAIDQEIATQRVAELTVTESDLKFCNPTDPTLTGERQAKARCDGLALNVAPPAGTVQAIEALQDQLEDAETDRNDLRLQEADLADRLQRERAGEGGGDTTGRRGVGPIAEALERDLVALRARLATAEQLVMTRQESLQAALVASSATSGSFAQTMEAAIAGRLAEEEAKFSAQPGLLERLEALGDLTGRHRDLLWARLFLTLFLVTLDSMPVFAKAMSGKTTYDGLLQARLSARERAARSSLTAEGDDWAAEIAHRSFGQEQRRLVAKRRIDVTRDKQLLLLDAEHRADRAQHGGSEAEIGEALFEDGPVGPTIELSWEQPQEERSRPGLIRRLLRPDPPRATGGSREPRPDPRPSPGPVGGDLDASGDHDDGFDTAPWQPDEGTPWGRWTIEDGWAGGPDSHDDGDGSDLDVPPTLAADGASWFDEVTRTDDGEVFDGAR